MKTRHLIFRELHTTSAKVHKMETKRKRIENFLMIYTVFLQAYLVNNPDVDAFWR